MATLLRKSGFDCPASASSRLAPTEVADLYNCRPRSRTICSRPINGRQKSTTSQLKRNDRSLMSYGFSMFMQTARHVPRKFAGDSLNCLEKYAEPAPRTHARL